MKRHAYAWGAARADHQDGIRAARAVVLGAMMGIVLWIPIVAAVWWVLR